MNLPRVILPLVVIASASLLALPSSANNAQAGKMVVLNVRVTDPTGKAVRDVPRDAFQVTEDGVPQKIELFMNEEIPLSYALAIDSSGTMRSRFGAIVEAAKNIVNANRDTDETFLVRFISSDKIETVQEFTTDKRVLLNLLDGFYVEGGSTAVIDAIYLTAEHLAQRKTDPNQLRRKVLILVTDGDDRISYYTKDKLFRLLASTDTQIFTIGFMTDLKPDQRDKAIKLLTQLAAETGGRTFFPKSTQDLERISNDIINDIRTQYVIGYVPSIESKNSFHKTVVSITQGADQDKRVAITRVGYGTSK
jgi:Ca-activated chloride channel family protein